MVRACRPSHWLKNLLVIVPLLMSHEITRPGVWPAAAAAFLAFSLGASAVYLFNDVMDYRADQLHPVKRFRPIAAGLLERRKAGCIAAGSLCSAGWFAYKVGGDFPVLFWSYLVATTSYSCGLKRVMLVDTLLLALFYVLRLYAGSRATQTPVSDWLLCFSLFFFLGLASQKRVAELLDWPESPAIRHRGYEKGDQHMMTTMGICASFLSVMILALYMQSAEVASHYRASGIMWGVLPMLLYWVSRVWLLTGRRTLKEDAIAFALRDPASYAVLVLIFAILLSAQPY